MKHARYDQITVGGAPCEIMRASFSASSFKRHFHDTYTLGLVRQGVNAFRTGARNEEVPAGQICIVNPGDVHDGGQSRRPWSYDNIFVPQALMDTVAEDVGVPAEIAFDSGCITNRTAIRALDRFFRLVFDLAGAADLVEEAFWQALGTLLLTAQPRLIVKGTDRCDGSAPQHGDRAVHYIRDCWDQDLTLDSIAAAAGVSRFSVIRATSSRVGLTPHALLIQERVQQAKARIVAGMPIAEAAIECRFSDQAHLTREVTRHLGVTPGVIRRGAQGKWSSTLANGVA